MSVYSKLNQARVKFHGLKLEKSGFNKFAGYAYFQLSDFLIPALKVFEEVGLCGLVSFTKDEASMTVVDVETGQEVRITSPMSSAALKGCHEVQNVGAVETYQRRYLWQAALEMVEHDALDMTMGGKAKGAKDQPKEPAKIPESITEARATELEEAALTIIDAHNTGHQMKAAEIYYGLPDNEEKLYVWGLLKENPPVRTALKRNSPHKAADIAKSRPDLQPIPA